MSKMEKKMQDVAYQVLENDNDIEIEIVYHFSDIHIKNFRRHDEYKNVFENLYTELKKHIGNHNEKSLIVVTGDIMDSKELSGDAMYIARYFFKNLTDITSVIMIAGNHDCNLS